MKKLGFRRLTVSTHGLRDGILSSFLDDPVGYHQGKLGRIPPKKIKSQIEKEILPNARDFLQKLQSFDLVGSREVEIVLFSLQWMIVNASSLRPEALFAMMMD